jgi:hypothetical protein
VTHYKAEFHGLAPATTYAYRVGASDASCHWHCFSTASADPAPFRFIYLGDAQNGLRKAWPPLVRAAFAAVPDARFVAHAGDLPMKDDDRQSASWWSGSEGHRVVRCSSPETTMSSVRPEQVFAAQTFNAHSRWPTVPPIFPSWRDRATTSTTRVCVVALTNASPTTTQGVQRSRSGKRS